MSYAKLESLPKASDEEWLDKAALGLWIFEGGAEKEWDQINEGTLYNLKKCASFVLEQVRGLSLSAAAESPPKASDESEFIEQARIKGGKAGSAYSGGLIEKSIDYGNGFVDGTDWAYQHLALRNTAEASRLISAEDMAKCGQVAFTGFGATSKAETASSEEES